MDNQCFSYHSRQVLALLPPCRLSEIPYQHDFVLGVARVNNQSQLLWTALNSLSAASRDVAPYVANLYHTQQRGDQAYPHHYRRHRHHLTYHYARWIVSPVH